MFYYYKINKKIKNRCSSQLSGVVGMLIGALQANEFGAKRGTYLGNTDFYCDRLGSGHFMTITSWLRFRSGLISDSPGWWSCRSVTLDSVDKINCRNSMNCRIIIQW